MIKIVLISLLLPAIVILCVGCIHTRIPAFKIKLDNKTGFPDSSIRITNKVRIDGDSYFKSRWSNNTKAIEIKKAQQELKLEKGELNTMSLSACSLLRNKHAIGELELRSGTDESLVSIEYYPDGHYNDKHSQPIKNEERLSFKKDVLVLKEFTCKIALPDFLVMLIENNPDEKKWLKYKHVLVKIKAYGRMLNYSLPIEDKVEDTIIKYILLPSKMVNETVPVEVSFNATGNVHVMDINLSYDQPSHAVVWSQQSIIRLQEIVSYWLAEEQKADMFIQLTKHGGIIWSTSLATQLFVTCSNPSYEVAGRPGFASNNQVLVKFLLSKGADPDAKNNNGEPAIIALTLRNSTASVIELIKAGADSNASPGGKSVLQWAEQRNNTELIAFLKSIEKK